MEQVGWSSEKDLNFARNNQNLKTLGEKDLKTFCEKDLKTLHEKDLKTLCEKDFNLKVVRSPHCN